ncbi:hypothetical protein [Mariniblastus fucicola]|uniref:Uncharacterized protein n=1 Tax=Mariniblastus fucicola TaxID=980251 RepID=A0A5B9P9Z1_9BACT|nr:hypothetical protein [Mariniblastus fucicola]QEG23577.1 hypothetical protein MFFC18_34780 [Mariniblastus fucicola]
MSPNVSRCRHYQVKWLTSHSCRCSSCGKHGHWFENEGLVMWVRAEREASSHAAEPAAICNLLLSETQRRMPNMAG